MKKHRRWKIAALAISVLILAVWILGAGFTPLEPRTAKIINQPIGYLDGEIKYELIPRVNSGQRVNVVWKWPWPMSEIKETIKFEDLNFQKKIVLYSLDEESGNPKDRHTILAIVVSGTLEVEEWEKFSRSYNPEEFNAKIKEKGWDFPELTTIDHWKVIFANLLLSTAKDRLDHLFRDGISRYQYVKTLREANPELATVEAIENFLKTKEPWVWTFGLTTVERFKENPDNLMPAIYFGTPGAFELYGVITSKKFLDNFEQNLKEIQDKKEIFYRLTKPDLLREAELLFKDFNQSLLVPKEMLYLEAKKFLDKQPGYSKEGQLAFWILLELEWEKAQLLNDQETKEEILTRLIPAIRELPDFADKLNSSYWRFIIEIALDNPRATNEALEKKANLALLKSPVLWGELKETVSQSWLWQIKNLSIEVKTMPLFINDKVDPDFYFYYKTKEEKRER